MTVPAPMSSNNGASFDEGERIIDPACYLHPENIDGCQAEEKDPLDQDFFPGVSGARYSR